MFIFMCVLCIALLVCESLCDCVVVFCPMFIFMCVLCIALLVCESLIDCVVVLVQCLSLCVYLYCFVSV